MFLFELNQPDFKSELIVQDCPVSVDATCKVNISRNIVDWCFMECTRTSN